MEEPDYYLFLTAYEYETRENDVHVNRIESVQKNFFGYSLKKLVIEFPPYLFKCSMLNIEQLSDRRKNAKLLYVFDVLSRQIDSPKLLSLLLAGFINLDIKSV